MSFNLKQAIQNGITRFKKLNGEPHYVAMGMAIGVFVALTPTIPFHTIIAVGLSVILRASKTAAVIGVWFSNPLTIPLIYFGSYKVGGLLFSDLSLCEGSCESISQLLELGIAVTLVTIAGGILLGIVPAIAAYFITRRIIAARRSRQISVHQINRANHTEYF